MLYKEEKDVIYTVDIQTDKDNNIIFDFYADYGKFGTDESLAGYKFSAKRLLEILQKVEKTEEEYL